MKSKKSQIIRVAVQFIKLQLAGNIIFWGTYLGYFISDYFLGRQDLWALAIASLLSHILFFVVSREWVFDTATGKRKTHKEIVRFIIFMGFNYFLNLAIIEGLRIYFDISPYIGQFISGFFFGVWTYLGLKFWVFSETPRHSPLTYRRRRSSK